MKKLGRGCILCMTSQCLQCSGFFWQCHLFLFLTVNAGISRSTSGVKPIMILQTIVKKWSVVWSVSTYEARKKTRLDYGNSLNKKISLKAFFQLNRDIFFILKKKPNWKRSLNTNIFWLNINIFSLNEKFFTLQKYLFHFSLNINLYIF